MTDRIPTELSQKDVAERDVITFDFTLSKSALSTSIVSNVMTIEYSSGTQDPTPETVLDGSSQISGFLVLQAVHAGVIGSKYLIRCVATFNDSTVRTLAGFLPIIRIH